MNEAEFMEDCCQKTGILKRFNSEARKDCTNRHPEAAKKQPCPEERKRASGRMKWASTRQECESVSRDKVWKRSVRVKEKGEERVVWVLTDFLPASTTFQDHLSALGHGAGEAGLKNSSQQGDENGFLVSHSCTAGWSCREILIDTERGET